MKNEVQVIESEAEWVEKLSPFPQHHLLQNWKWGELKAQFAWQPYRVYHQDTGGLAQVLFKKAPLGHTIAYIPKAPIIKDPTTDRISSFLSALHTFVKKQKAIFLKIEPNGVAETMWDLGQYGFQEASSVQPSTTIFVSLAAAENEILAKMKSKTRYNIRLAAKKGVTVRVGQAEDLVHFNRLMEITAERDQFGIHGTNYYQAVYSQFSDTERAILFAEYEGKVLATLMVLRQGETAYYLYGGSSNEERNRMPAYLLQWEAMKWAKAQGCTNYDLWGIPDADKEELERGFMQRSDGLWGVYRFKRGFGGEVIHTPGAFDYIYKPLIYKAYKLYLKMR